MLPIPEEARVMRGQNFAPRQKAVPEFSSEGQGRSLQVSDIVLIIVFALGGFNAFLT